MNLISIQLYRYKADTLDLSGRTTLNYLIFGDYSPIYTQYNQNDHSSIAHLNLSGCSALYELWCPNSVLADIDLTGCSSIGIINVQYTAIKTLDLTAISYWDLENLGWYWTAERGFNHCPNLKVYFSDGSIFYDEKSLPYHHSYYPEGWDDYD